jgi:hypothetical protein
MTWPNEIINSDDATKSLVRPIRAETQLPDEGILLPTNIKGEINHKKNWVLILDSAEENDFSLPSKCVRENQRENVQIL